MSWACVAISLLAAGAAQANGNVIVSYVTPQKTSYSAPQSSYGGGGYDSSGYDKYGYDRNGRDNRGYGKNRKDKDDKDLCPPRHKPRPPSRC